MNQTDPNVGLSAPPDSDFHSAPPVSPQLRFFQALSGLLLLVLIGGAAFYFYRQHQLQPITILIDDKPITTVSDISIADTLTQKVYALKLGDGFMAEGKPQLKETVQMQRADSNAPLDTTDQAVAKIAQAVQITVLADAILIDGKVAAALPDKDTAQAALDGVRKHYADMPPSDTVTDNPSFRENVTIDRRRVSSDVCRADPEQVTQLLITAPPAKSYTVKPREMGWSIARKFHLTFSEFVRANSGRNLDRLTPGDSVNVSQSYPPLTVIVHKQSVSIEPIVPGATLVAGGERRVTSIATYVNGVRTGEMMPVSAYTVHRATPSKYLD